MLCALPHIGWASGGRANGTRSTNSVIEFPRARSIASGTSAGQHRIQRLGVPPNCRDARHTYPSCKVYSARPGRCFGSVGRIGPVAQNAFPAFRAADHIAGGESRLQGFGFRKGLRIGLRSAEPAHDGQFPDLCHLRPSIVAYTTRPQSAHRSSNGRLHPHGTPGCWIVSGPSRKPKMKGPEGDRHRQCRAWGFTCSSKGGRMKSTRFDHPPLFRGALCASEHKGKDIFCRLRMMSPQQFGSDASDEEFLTYGKNASTA
jgi:hypothetical protein